MGQRDSIRKFGDADMYTKTRLFDDLQVHQIELDGDGLNSDVNTPKHLGATYGRYTNLFDCIPVGCLALDQAGNVLTINLVGSAILGVARTVIIGQPFINQVHQDSSHAFFCHLRQAFNSSSNTTVELRFTNLLAKTKHIRLESLVMENANVCCTVIMDIDQLKETTSNRELLHENRKLIQNLFIAQENERHLLAHELHDELGQWLTAIYVESETISNHFDSESAVGTGALAIIECVKKMHVVIRDRLYQLRPALLDTLGLVDALLELKKHWCSHHPDITFEFIFEGELATLGEHINITVFRIVQETLNNISGHARATWAQVQLSASGDTLSLSVEDNGTGYYPDPTSKGLGILGMRERAIAAGGKFSVHNVLDHGARINVKLPLGGSNKRRRTDDL